MPTPEQRAREKIDQLLTAASWRVQSREQLNLGAGRGVAVREFPLTTGFADYLLFVARKPIGVVEAKPVGTPLSGVEPQSEKYSAGLPAHLTPWHRPLPFLYQSTGVETFFTHTRDPEPRSRRTFAFHRPETLAEWAGRGEVTSPPEPADALLARVLAERRARWQAEHPGKRYKEPALPDTSDLPRLPEGWVWARIEQLTDLSSGKAFKKSEYSEVGIRLLQIANVSFGKIVWDAEAFMPPHYLKKYPNLVLKPGDLLMALNRPILNGALKIGELKAGDTPAILYQRVGRFDFYNRSIKGYFFYFCQSPLFVSRLEKSLQGVDQPFVTKPKLLGIPIPLPPLAEQHRIVAEVERRLTTVAELEKQVEVALRRAERLRQAVLKRAFEGRLVPQDPADEPASALLARIQAARAKRSGEVTSPQPRQMQLPMT